MNSNFIKIAISEERITHENLRLRGEIRRNELISIYSAKLEHLLTGVGLASEAPEFTLKVESGGIAAHWLKEGYHAWIGANLIFKKMPSWKAMEPVFEMLATRDFDIDAWTSEDDAASFSRVYAYTLLGGTGKADNVTVKITCTLEGDNDTCKRVVVGHTEPRVLPSEPIYEIHCGDEVRNDRPLEDNPFSGE